MPLMLFSVGQHHVPCSFNDVHACALYAGNTVCRLEFAATGYCLQGPPSRQASSNQSTLNCLPGPAEVILCLTCWKSIDLQGCGSPHQCGPAHQALTLPAFCLTLFPQSRPHVQFQSLGTGRPQQNTD